jgi:3-oxoacyl-(acyl-carrier-protein) synthase
MLANGCSAGLDALGMAWMALHSGVAKRALVVAVDLPLIPELLRDFQETRLLSGSAINDPLSPETDGFVPGEAAAAVTLELGSSGFCEVASYAANSDAYDSLMVPQDGAQLAALMGGVLSPDLICPHATGTPNHAVGETAALRRAFPQNMPPLLLLKPFTGHALGASGLLDVALIAGAMREGEVPGNLEGLHAPDGVSLPVRSMQPSSVLKIASGMGGHNAAVLLRKASGRDSQ